MIVGAVILSGVLGDIGAIPLYDGVEFPFTSLIEVAIILLAAFLSYKTTKKEVREANNFSWDAISEVAVLFIGIFITMVPALMILKAKGADLGLTHPWQFFWISSGCQRIHHPDSGRIGYDSSGDPDGYFSGSCFHGSDYLYWKCTKLHGALHCRGKRDQDAILLWIYGMVIKLSNTGIFDRHTDFFPGIRENAGFILF